MNQRIHGAWRRERDEKAGGAPQNRGGGARRYIHAVIVYMFNRLRLRYGARPRAAIARSSMTQPYGAKILYVAVVWRY